MADFLPAFEFTAKVVKHAASLVADSIAECRKAFADPESGDYLSCAGADGLAEALCEREAEQEVSEPRTDNHNHHPDFYTWDHAAYLARQGSWCYEHFTGVGSCMHKPHETSVAPTPCATDDPAVVSDDPAGSLKPPEPVAERPPGEGPDEVCPIRSRPSSGLPTIAELFADVEDAIDQPLSAVAELDWPYLAKALRIVADFFDPK